MSKQIFFLSKHCESKAHCNACRNSQNFRQQILKAFDIPQLFEFERDGKLVTVKTYADQKSEFICPWKATPEKVEPIKYPPLHKQVKNVAKAAGKVVKNVAKGKKVIVPDKEKEARLAVCRECAVWDKKKGRCKKCGCYGKWKARLRSENCPLGKW